MSEYTFLNEGQRFYLQVYFSHYFGNVPHNVAHNGGEMCFGNSSRTNPKEDYSMLQWERGTHDIHELRYIHELDTELLPVVPGNK